MKYHRINNAGDDIHLPVAVSLKFQITASFWAHDLYLSCKDLDTFDVYKLEVFILGMQSAFLWINPSERFDFLTLRLKQPLVHGGAGIFILMKILSKEIIVPFNTVLPHWRQSKPACLALTAKNTLSQWWSHSNIPWLLKLQGDTRASPQDAGWRISINTSC